MKKYALAICIVLFHFVYAWSATIKVSTIGDLQQAIQKAVAGDVIVLTTGTYTVGADIIVACKGTAEKPIIITAEEKNKTELTGMSGFSIVAPASYVIIKDFLFTHASSKARSGSGTSFCRWTHNIFETAGSGEDLTIAGTDHQVDYNTFRNKNAMGRFLAIRGTGSQIAERLWIHHNYFKSYKDQGGANGAEAFQFGLSGFSMSSSNSVVEYNLFEDCAGENELISVKASGVTLRYNTIRDCPAQFTLRHGNKCQVYSNYFINTPGLRIFGDDHLVHSNYFENCNPAITIGNGDGEVAEGAQLTAHDRPDRVLIAFNTLVNNQVNITMTGRKDGMGATQITIINNIIRGGGPAATISGPMEKSRWEENMIFSTKGAGDMPKGGYTETDPKLMRDANGIFHLQPTSPAISKKKRYPEIVVDIDGQERKSMPDTGADELSTEPVKAKVLTVIDVGVDAK
ncbi:MAG: polysaccharide lyase 6 family protein [Flavisolibacter sp.]